MSETWGEIPGRRIQGIELVLLVFLSRKEFLNGEKSDNKSDLFPMQEEVQGEKGSASKIFAVSHVQKLQR